MTKELLFNFRQIAWVYLSQFDNNDMREALSNTIFYPEAPDHFINHPNYEKSFDLKVQYINLAYTTGAYKKVDQWIREDKWCDPTMKRIYLESLKLQNFAKPKLEDSKPLH